MLKNLRELHQYRALLWSLTVRELRARYRASVLGFLWTFLNPTLSMAVYALVFGVLLKRAQPIANYPYFIFVGLLPWLFFSSSVGGGSTAVSDRRDLLTKVRFPAQVLPATVVATNLANYLLSLPLLIALGALYGMWPTWHVVYFLPLVALQSVFTLAVTYLLSALNVAFRDLQHIVPNVLQLAFFLTPVLWPVSDAKEPWLQTLILRCNPMAAFMEGYRDIFYMHIRPPFIPLGIVAIVSVVLLWVSSTVFERRREEFAELV
jgi:lipopolysaccharide transport system permease protein